MEFQRLFRDHRGSAFAGLSIGSNSGINNPILHPVQMPKQSRDNCDSRLSAVIREYISAVAGVVGIKGGLVSAMFNLELSDVSASDWRPLHDR